MARICGRVIPAAVPLNPNSRTYGITLGSLSQSLQMLVNSGVRFPHARQGPCVNILRNHFRITSPSYAASLISTTRTSRPLPRSSSTRCWAMNAVAHCDSKTQCPAPRFPGGGMICTMNFSGPRIIGSAVGVSIWLTQSGTLMGRITTLSTRSRVHGNVSLGTVLCACGLGEVCEHDSSTAPDPFLATGSGMACPVARQGRCNPSMGSSELPGNPPNGWVFNWC